MVGPDVPSPFQGLSEADLQAIFAAGTATPELELMKKQLEMAEQLRGTATPEGRQAGRVYVAANPLEHIGAGLRRYRGHQQMGQIQDQMAQRIGDLAGQRQQAASAILRSLYGSQ